MVEGYVSSSTNAVHVSAVRCWSSTDTWWKIPSLTNRQKIILTPSTVILDSQRSQLIEVPLGSSGCHPWVKVPDKPSLSPSPIPSSAHLLCHTLSEIMQRAQCLGDRDQMCVYTYVHIYTFPCIFSTHVPGCVSTYRCIVPATTKIMFAPLTATRTGFFPNGTSVSILCS